MLMYVCVVIWCFSGQSLCHTYVLCGRRLSLYFLILIYVTKYLSQVYNDSFAGLIKKC